AADQFRPCSPVRCQLVGAVMDYSRDPDGPLVDWAAGGGAHGDKASNPARRTFPDGRGSSVVVLLDVLASICSGNRGSPPALQLVWEFLGAGFGARCACKTSADQDLASFLGAPRGGAKGEPLAVRILDFVDTLMTVPLCADGQPFSAAEIPDLGSPGNVAYVVRNVFGFGGRANPLVHSRFGSFAARSARAIWAAVGVNLRACTGGPSVVARGSTAECAVTLDVILTWWLVPGIPFSRSEGECACAPLPASSREVSLRHAWVGISCAVGTKCIMMGLPPEFVDVSVEMLGPLRNAGRMAQVVPAAALFVSSLSSAYPGSQRAQEREAAASPPGT
ncbi:unnamed protein product, partial [Prorocentrum cordatum]